MDSLGRTDTAAFVRALPTPSSFDAAFESGRYVALPADWLIAVTDVVQSRMAIADGRYKAVNMAGVAVISAAMNELGTRDIPFIFGGDGAALAIAPAERDAIAMVLGKLKAFCAEELDLELRAAIVPVTRIREDGFDVRTGAVRLSEAVNNYAFVGGGVSHAERLMKQGLFAVERAAPGERPDLTGLSCRWTPVSAPDRKIVSLIVEPGEKIGANTFTAAARETIAEFGFADAGNPMPPEGPVVRWPVGGFDLEARASRGGRSLGLARARLYLQSLLGWFLFNTGIPLGRFHPNRYRRYTSLNTDFRKVQDGLRMTLSLSLSAVARLESHLEARRATGVLRYGMFVQDSALLTCFVPSVMEDSHFHFLDGAGGGYAAAASNMRG
jgi:hypothetical protein